MKIYDSVTIASDITHAKSLDTAALRLGPLGVLTLEAAAGDVGLATT